MELRTLNPNRLLPLLGAGLSLTCAIHCVLTPFLLGALPMVSVLHHDAEAWVIGVAAVLAVGSGLWSFRRHRVPYVPLGLAGAVALLVAGHWLGHDHPFGTPFTATAGFTMAGLQWFGVRRSRAHSGEECCSTSTTT